MKRVVIFDLGGVVFRWQPLALIQQLFSTQIPHQAAAKQWADQVFQGFAPGSDWAEFDLGQIEPQDLATRISQRTQFDVADIELLIERIPPHLIPNEGTVELIKQLKQAGNTLYYLSNMPAPYAQHLLKTNGFFEHFDDGIFSADVHEIKPNAAIFKIAQERWTFASTPVFIDDVAHNIDSAKAQGWHGIQFENPQQDTTELLALNFKF